MEETTAIQTTIDDYHFHLLEHWTGRVTVKQGEDNGILVLDRETAVQAIRDLLKNCVPSLVFNGHDYPTQDSLNVAVDDELDFDIDAADVFHEPIDYPEPDLLI